MADLTDSWSVTSTVAAKAVPPPRSTWPATSSISVADLARTATEAPAPASESAMARPMPRPPPVTTATCPATGVCSMLVMGRRQPELGDEVAATWSRFLPWLLTGRAEWRIMLAIRARPARVRHDQRGVRYGQRGVRYGQRGVRHGLGSICFRRGTDPGSRRGIRNRRRPVGELGPGLRRPVVDGGVGVPRLLRCRQPSAPGVVARPRPRSARRGDQSHHGRDPRRPWPDRLVRVGNRPRHPAGA